MAVSLLILFLGLLFFSSPTLAGTYYLKNLHLGQAREDLKNRRELPVNHYLGGRYQEKNWQVDGNFQIYRDWERKKDDFDIYESNFTGRFSESQLEVKAGRQFFTPGFDLFLVDGIKLGWQFSSQAGMGIFSGVPRYTEIGDIKVDANLLSGLQFLFNGLGFTGNSSVIYLRKDFNHGDWIEKDQLSLAQYLIYDGKKAEKIRPYFGGEYQISGKILEQATSGVYWNPKRPLSFNLEFNLFDENRRELKETLTAFHADGRIYQGRFGGRQKLTSDLEFFQNYIFGRFKNPAGADRNAHQIEAGFQYFIWPIALQVVPSYGFTKSYGGRVDKVSVGLEKNIGRRVSIVATNDYAQFEKVTHDNGKAFSSFLRAGWHIRPSLSIGSHTAFLKNNEVKREWRGGLFLQWGLGVDPIYPQSEKGILAL